MPRGRRKSLIRKVNIDAYIPTDLNEAVRARLYDPKLGAPAYGAMSVLITQLLSDWVKTVPLNPRTEAIKQKELSNDLDRL